MVCTPLVALLVYTDAFSNFGQPEMLVVRLATKCVISDSSWNQGSNWAGFALVRIALFSVLGSQRERERVKLFPKIHL